MLEIYQVQKGRFEPVVEVPPGNRVIMDTSQPVDKIVRQVIDIVNRGVEDD